MTSAEIAKERLMWCVAHRRNGGVWERVRSRERRIEIYPGGPVLSELIPAYRWSYA